MAGKAGHRDFGHVRKLPSGRWQASYLDPDGRTYESQQGNARAVRHKADQTFDTRMDAEAWLTDERRLVSAGVWTSPAQRREDRAAQPLLFGEYAAAWLEGRKVKGRPLADRTRDHYQSLLDAYILPTFAQTPIKAIVPVMVDHWYELVAIGRPTTQAHAYSLLRTILGTAVDRGVITTANPAKVRGGGTADPVKMVKPATLAELEAIAKNVPERHQLLVLLAAWCALRFGELTELRRKDVDTKSGVLHVRRGVVRSKSAGVVTKKPKSAAGVRDVHIPPHLLPSVRQHLLEHTGPGKEGLLFPGANGGHLAPSAFYGRPATLNASGELKTPGWGWYAARQAADREDLRFHDLRHTGAVLAAQTGATLKELMSRLGHSTSAAALRYQHAAAERDKEIAAKLSAMATGGES